MEIKYRFVFVWVSHSCASCYIILCITTGNKTDGFGHKILLWGRWIRWISHNSLLNWMTESLCRKQPNSPGFFSLILFLKYTKNKLLNSGSGEKFKASLAICTSPLGQGEPSCRLPDRWQLLHLWLHKGALLVLCEAFPSDKWCFPVSPYPSKPLNEFDCALKVHPCHRSELISRGKVSFLLIHIIFLICHTISSALNP